MGLELYTVLKSHMYNAPIILVILDSHVQVMYYRQGLIIIVSHFSNTWSSKVWAKCTPMAQLSFKITQLKTLGQANLIGCFSSATSWIYVREGCHYIIHYFTIQYRQAKKMTS